MSFIITHITTLIGAIFFLVLLQLNIWCHLFSLIFLLLLLSLLIFVK